MARVSAGLCAWSQYPDCRHARFQGQPGNGCGRSSGGTQHRFLQFHHVPYHLHADPGTLARAERYGGTVTPVGNSKGIRLDADFFKSHPEFNGKVDATVIADGQVLLSAKSAKRRLPEDEDADPVMLGFLSFLQKQMAEHPELIEPADRAQLARIRKLVKGVDVE